MAIRARRGGRDRLTGGAPPPAVDAAFATSSVDSITALSIVLVPPMVVLSSGLLGASINLGPLVAVGLGTMAGAGSKAARGSLSLGKKGLSKARSGASSASSRLGVGGLAAGVPLIGGDERQAGDSNDRMGLNDNTAAEPDAVGVSGGESGVTYADKDVNEIANPDEPVTADDVDDGTATTTGTNAAPPDDGETTTDHAGGIPASNRELEARIDRLEQKIDGLVGEDAAGGDGPSDGPEAADADAAGQDKTFKQGMVDKLGGAFTSVGVTGVVTTVGGDLAAKYGPQLVGAASQHAPQAVDAAQSVPGGGLLVSMAAVGGAAGLQAASSYSGEKGTAKLRSRVRAGYESFSNPDDSLFDTARTLVGRRDGKAQSDSTASVADGSDETKW